MPVPLDDDSSKDPILEAILREEVKQFVTRKNNIRRNIQRTFGLIWGQCSSALQAYIKGQLGYITASDTYDVKWLMRETKKAVNGIDSKANPYATMHEAIGIMYRMRQGQHESNDGYVERFKNNALTVDMVQGSNIFYSPGIAGKSYAEASNEEIYSARQANMAVLMLLNSDPNRYGNLSTSLKEGASLGRDEYPTTVAGMYELMVKSDKSNARNYNTRARRGNLFAQSGDGANNEDTVPGSDGVIHSHILCFNCQKYGHYSSTCPSPDRRRGGATALLRGTCLACKMDQEPIIEDHRLLLDTCSTDNVCNNIKLLFDVRQCRRDESLVIMTNGGSMRYNTIGRMGILPISSYYNKNSLANIVSMQKLLEVEGITISMNSSISKSILVTTKDGLTYDFIQGADGLYSYDMRKEPRKCSKTTNDNNVELLNYYGNINMSFLNHVASNKRIFTCNEIKRADDAREL